MNRLAAALAIAVVLTGCSPSVDSFSVHRYAIEIGNHWEFPPLDRTVNDAAIATQLYHDIRALRPDTATHGCAIHAKQRSSGTKGSSQCAVVRR